MSAARRSAAAKFDIVALDADADHLHPRTSGTLDLLSLDQALNALADRDAVAAQVVELRYFSGLTIDEVAKVLEIAGFSRPSRSQARF